MGIQEGAISNHLEKVIARTPLKRIGAPSEIADMVKYLMSPSADFINGTTITIDGGMSCYLG